MQHLDLALVAVGELAFLPMGGRHGQVAQVQRHEVVGLAGEGAQTLVGAGGELGVKAHVGGVGPVVPLAQVDQPAVRENVFEVEGFAPAGVGQHDVGCEAGLLELHQALEHRLAMQHRGFKAGAIGVGVGRGGAVRLVAQRLHARQAGCALASEGDELDVGAGLQGQGHMPELAGKVLVDEQHTCPAAGLRARCSWHGGGVGWTGF